MKTVFLLCALALPMNKEKDYRLLVEFLEHYRPGYFVILVNNKERAVGKEYKWTPILYRGLQVWLKRDA